MSNPEEGLIIAYHSFGPAYMKAKNGALKDAQLPKLQQWSDTTFLTWYVTLQSPGVRG